jgi:hypothetical protein
MANPEHLELLQGVDVWNEWRAIEAGEPRRGDGASFVETNLVRRNFH